MNLQTTVAHQPPQRDDWLCSPDLMSVDNKLDVLFGPADEATTAWITASLAIGRADYGMPRGER